MPQAQRGRKEENTRFSPPSTQPQRLDRRPPSSQKKPSLPPLQQLTPEDKRLLERASLYGRFSIPDARETAAHAVRLLAPGVNPEFKTFLGKVRASLRLGAHNKPEPLEQGNQSPSFNYERLRELVGILYNYGIELDYQVNKDHRFLENLAYQLEWYGKWLNPRRVENYSSKLSRKDIEEAVARAKKWRIELAHIIREIAAGADPKSPEIAHRLAEVLRTARPY